MAKNISNLDKSLKQNITPEDIGAAASSHGTHLTIGTGASNAAAGNHTHSNYATSSHNHGLLHDNFTVEVANTTTDNGWSMINSNYDGYLLKSMRFGASSPAWGVGNYGSGIAFGGSDTKGVISMAYNSPSIKFAAGNGTKPVWNIGLTGTSGTNYNLNNFASSSHGTHVPTPQTASNTKFLRNDNTWQDVTCANIGAATAGQLTATNANIGALSSLQTSNKSNLVAAINEVFQSGSNAKQKLVDALTSNNINCSTSDSWDTLIGHISSLGGGSLDIISATSLPATGKENQICVVTSNPTDKFLFTSSDSDISSVTDNTIIIHSSVEVTTSNYITQSGNFKSTFEISKCIQSGVIVPSYIYTNGAWQEFTPNRIIWIENGKFLIDNELMNNTSMPSNSYVKYSSTLKGMGFTTGSTTGESLAYATSRVKVDLSSYKRAYIQYYKNLASGDTHWMAAEPTLFVSGTMGIGRKQSKLTTKDIATITSDTYIKGAGNITNFSNYALYEATYDLSNLTGTKYLGIGLNMSGSTAIYITTLYFY